jgi:hypothetical protein
MEMAVSLAGIARHAAVRILDLFIRLSSNRQLQDS